MAKANTASVINTRLKPGVNNNLVLAPHNLCHPRYTLMV